MAVANECNLPEDFDWCVFGWFFDAAEMEEGDYIDED
jgi:hypothetical protein